MADECDIANDRAQAELENRIAEFMYRLNQMGNERDIEAETCNGCSYATKAAWGRKCDSWRDCRDDIEKREKFGRGLK